MAADAAGSIEKGTRKMVVPTLVDNPLLPVSPFLG